MLSEVNFEEGMTGKGAPGGLLGAGKIVSGWKGWIQGLCLVCEASLGPLSVFMLHSNVFQKGKRMVTYPDILFTHSRGILERSISEAGTGLSIGDTAVNKM